MKISELFEDFAHKALTETEFDNLNAPDAKNTNDRYKVGKIAFDNEDGIGVTANNGNVHYRGFVVCLTPSDFLRLAYPADREEAAKKIAEHIKNREPLGAPFLDVKFNEKDFSQGEPLEVEVLGHEGRARMTAIRMVNGDSTKIPVHIIPRGEVRARHFDEKFFSALRKVGMVPEKSSGPPRHVDIGKIFWMGKTL